MLIAWFADPIIPWVFGGQWKGAVPFFQAFAPLSLAYSLSSLPSVVLFSQRKFRVLSLSRVLTAGIVLSGVGCCLLTGNLLSVPSMLVGGLALQGAALFPYSFHLVKTERVSECGLPHYPQADK
jgi:O-antigen/teichoic acid export membrane protein